MSETSHQNLQNFDPAEGFAAAKAWWELAGVDCDFAEDATAWLAPKKSAEPNNAPAQTKQTETAQRPREPANALERALSSKPAMQIAENAEGLPTDLAAFQNFWMEDASLAPLAPGQRVAPTGGEGAELMALVAQPDAQDTDQLLSGPQGQVFKAITRAMRLDQSQIYTSAVLPACMTIPDWNALAAQGLGTLTRHHITLAKPRRIVVFGRALEALLQDEGDALPPIMIAPSLDNIARSAGRRERFWKQWLDWTA